MKPLRLLALSALLAMSLSAYASVGCARAQANAVLEPPRLDVPMPPPRVVETIAIEEPPPVPTPPQELPVAPPVVQTPAPVVPPRTGSPRAVDPPKADVAAPAAAPKSEEKPSGPPPLQTAPSQQDARAVEEVHGLIGRASTDLDRVNYRALAAGARSQYEQARAFIKQAGDALKGKNFQFARILADKAATLAAQLSGM
jgi:hypothetical protein